MQKRTTGAATIDEYIRLFPGPVRKKLKELRKVIREEAPEAQEKISYQIPTFHLQRNLVHFAAYANHVGFYPTSSGIRAFESKLTNFKHSRGAIQFPLDEPLPIELIRSIVRYRVQEEMNKK